MGRRTAAVLRFIGIGWYIAICIVLGALGGRWLGRAIDGDTSEAIFIILGVLLGVLVAFYGLYQMTKTLRSDSNDSNGSDN